MDNTECLVTSGYSFEWYNIVKYAGQISVIHVVASNPVQDLRGKYDDIYSDGFGFAVEKLKAAAYKSANAVIGLTITHPQSSNTLVFALTGTAVKVKEIA